VTCGSHRWSFEWYIAEDAVEDIRVDYELIEAVVDVEKSLDQKLL
jgi:CO/xanthine dehydrogenase Mo-binding subunit